MTDQAQDTVRIDQWLWAARFFKTRSLAARAVRGGHVHVNGDRAKASRGVRPGDQLKISRGRMVQEVVIRSLSVRRGPATIAVTLYDETADSLARRENLREAARLARGTGPAAPPRRPDKRGRRQITRLRRDAES